MMHNIIKSMPVFASCMFTKVLNVNAMMSQTRKRRGAFSDARAPPTKKAEAPLKERYWTKIRDPSKLGVTFDADDGFLVTHVVPMQGAFNAGIEIGSRLLEIETRNGGSVELPVLKKGETVADNFKFGFQLKFEADVVRPDRNDNHGFLRACKEYARLMDEFPNDFSNVFIELEKLRLSPLEIELAQMHYDKMQSKMEEYAKNRPDHRNYSKRQRMKLEPVTALRALSQDTSTPIATLADLSGLADDFSLQDYLGKFDKDISTKLLMAHLERDEIVEHAMNLFAMNPDFEEFEVCQYHDNPEYENDERVRKDYDKEKAAIIEPGSKPDFETLNDEQKHNEQPDSGDMQGERSTGTD